MTVRELIELLEEFDGDTEVVIGMRQRYGSDFAMEITDVTEERVDTWYCDEANVVVITEGNQIGAVRYDSEDEDEYE